MYYSIQYLRFVAASLVVITHGFEGLPRYGRGDLGTDFTLGQCGVDIFFIISGLIMCLITDSRETDPGQFLVRRIARIAPTYWLITAVFVIILACFPQLFHSSMISVPHIVASFLFVAWPAPLTNDPLPVYQPGWTLNAEFFFYSLFALSMLLNQQKRMIISGAMIAILGLLHFSPLASWPITDFYTRPIMFEFLIGIGIAGLIKRNVSWPPLVCLAMVGVGVAALIVLQAAYPVWRLSNARVLIWGLPSGLIVGGLVLMEARIPKSRTLRLFGDASYSIYLTHFFTVNAVAQIWGRLNLRLHFNDYGLVVAGYVVSILAGIAFYLFIERPAIRLSHRMISANRPLTSVRQLAS